MNLGVFEPAEGLGRRNLCGGGGLGSVPTGDGGGDPQRQHRRKDNKKSGRTYTHTNRQRVKTTKSPHHQRIDRSCERCCDWRADSLHSASPSRPSPRRSRGSPPKKSRSPTPSSSSTS